MSTETMRYLRPTSGFQARFMRLLPFIPAILMWSAQSLVGLGWLAGAVGGGVQPGEGSSPASLAALFVTMILIGIGGVCFSIWRSTRSHRFLWALGSFLLAFFLFLGSLGD